MSTTAVDRGVTYRPPEVRPATELAPVAPEERIHALDLLRGWAMFGVLWSNLNDWYGTAEPAGGFDRALAWTQGWLLESRFYTLLCILFGVGFGIQLTRAAERGADVKATYYRRSLALLAIGIVHGLVIWNGDILTMYALVAFALVMFRTVSAKGILASAVLSWFVAPQLVGGVRFIAGQRYMVPRVNGATASWIFGHGTWLEIAPFRVEAYVDWIGRWGLTLYWTILATFLIGLWAVKSGYLRRALEDRATTARLLVVAIVAGAVGYAWQAWYPRILPPQPPRWTGATGQLFWGAWRIGYGLLNWSVEGTALAYAAALVLVGQTARGSRVLRPLASTGRMALTTYLTQSVVCTLLFYGYGLGLYGRFGFTGMFILTLVLFGCQMAASTWWLSRFRFGPAEWLWRTATYGSAPRMRLSDAS